MYFAVESLSLIDPMYTWSLEYFIKIFKVFIDESEKTTNLDKRVKNLIKEVTLKIYQNICQGLFQKDRILFRFT